MQYVIFYWRPAEKHFFPTGTTPNVVNSIANAAYPPMCAHWKKDPFTMVIYLYFTKIFVKCT